MTSPRVHIRIATAEDAEIVRDLAMRAFAEYREVLDPPPGILFESIEDVRAAITSQIVILAAKNDGPIATARLELRPTSAYIGRLAVLPDHRNQGIAALLMADLEARAIAAAKSESTVSVREALPANIRFFEYLGYVATAREPHPRVPTTYSITMTKPLSGR